jgi:pimeloyl-ACP methyl ester carboxylesterase
MHSKTLIIFALFFVLAIMVASALSYTRYKSLDDQYHLAGGLSAALTSGRVSYQWHGPENGELIVLVHGFSTPKFVWQRTIPELVKAGYRVLSYDHFGRGHSDRPTEDYTRNFYIRELNDLLDTLAIESPATFIGYSMGGGNVTSFAAQYPERVKQVVLLAPAGFVPAYSGLQKVVATPIIGEILLSIAGADNLMGDLASAVDNGHLNADAVAKFKQQFYIKGTPHALSSTLQHYPMYDLSDDYKTLGESQIKTTVIWGDNDSVVPISSAKIMQQAVPQLQLHSLANAEHDLTYARADEVNVLILAALKP